METKELEKLIRNIVEKSRMLKDKHVEYEYKNSPVNYACIFSRNQEEYKELLEVTHKIGQAIKETSTGFVFHIKPMQTSSGVLKLLKIRTPDITRSERGDADFTVFNFYEFEKKHLSKIGFKLINMPDYCMIELIDSEFDVRAYFSNPPLDKELGL